VLNNAALRRLRKRSLVIRITIPPRLFASQTAGLLTARTGATLRKHDIDIAAAGFSRIQWCAWRRFTGPYLGGEWWIVRSSLY
jgi:hypothetical protein